MNFEKISNLENLDYRELPKSPLFGFFTIELQSKKWILSDSIKKIFEDTEHLINPDYIFNTKIVTPSKFSILREHIEAIQHNRSFKIELQIANYNNQKDYTIYVTSDYVRDETTHRVKSIIGSISDVLDFKKSYNENKHFEQIINKAPEPIALLDKNYTYLLVNQPYESMAGLQYNEIVGRKLSEIIGSETFKKEIKHKFDACLKGKTIEFEDWFDYNHIGLRYVKVTYSPYFNNKNNIAGVVATKQDFTIQKRLTDALEKRVLSLSAVPSNSSSYQFSDLYNLAEIQSIQNSIANATEIASVIVDLQNNYITNPSNYITNENIDFKVLLENYCPNRNTSHTQNESFEISVYHNLLVGCSKIIAGNTQIAKWIFCTSLSNKSKSEQIFLKSKFNETGKALFLISEQFSRLASQNIEQAKYIFENKQTQTLLQTSKEFFSKVYKSNPLGIIIVNIKTNLITEISNSFTQIFGYSEAEVLNQSIFDISIYKDPLVYKTGINQLISNESVRNFNCTCRTKSGTEIYIMQLMERIFVDNNDFAIISYEDITEKKAIQDALAESEEKFRIMVNSSPDAIYIHSETEIFFANPVGLQLVGVERLSEISNHNMYDFLHSEYIDISRQSMKFLTDTKNPINNQLCKLVSITGNTITVDVTVFPIQYGGKQVFQTIARDITEHVTVLEKLRIREKELSAIFDVLPDQLLLFTIDGVLIDFNSPKKYLFPKSSKLAKNNKIENLYPKEIAGKISEAIHQSIIKDEIVHFDYQIEVQYKKRYFENRVIPLSNDEVILLVREITSEKTTRKLLEDSQKQLRSFALHLQNIREEERIMLSRELHDNLGQSLTALRMDMFRLLKKTEFLYSENLMREQNAMVKKTIEYIDTIIQYVRKLSREIRPSIIDDLGLFATIEWQAEDFMERTGINCKLETSLTKLELNNSCAIGVFRIIQESLTNIIRHANATNVVIEIIETKIEFCIKIKDNGSGFDLALLKRTKSLGVLSMQERTALFGGQLRIISNPNKGTTISLTIPITQKKND